MISLLFATALATDVPRAVMPHCFWGLDPWAASTEHPHSAPHLAKVPGPGVVATVNGHTLDTPEALRKAWASDGSASKCEVKTKDGTTHTFTLTGEPVEAVAPGTSDISRLQLAAVLSNPHSGGAWPMVKGGLDSLEAALSGASSTISWKNDKAWTERKVTGPAMPNLVTELFFIERLPEVHIPQDLWSQLLQGSTWEGGPKFMLQRGTKGYDGLRVTGVQRGSVFEQAGLRNGDVFHEVNGKAITSIDVRDAIIEELRAMKPGPVELLIRRANADAVVTVVVDP